MKKSVLSFIVLIFAIYSYSQDIDTATFNEYREYRQIFDTEVKSFQDTDEKSQPEYKVLLPENTPDVFLEIPSLENKIYSIGISDPGMHPQEGYKLALMRAKSLLAFFRESNIQHISDMFEEEYSGSRYGDIINKYIDFFRIKAEFAIDTNNVSIIADTINKYGETLVLLEYMSLSNKQNEFIHCSSDCLITEFRSNSTYEINQRVEIYAEVISNNTNAGSYHFISRRVENNFDVNSKYNEKDIDPPLYTLKYKNSVPENDTTTSKLIGSKLTDGLWNAYIDCLIQNLFLDTKLRSGRLKSTSDMHTSKYQNINREIITSKASLKIDRIILLNNRIFLDISIL